MMPAFEQGAASKGQPVVVVDDDEVAAVYAAWLLKYAGVKDVVVYRSVMAAIEGMRNGVPAMLLCDIEMADGGGFAVLDAIRDQAGTCSVLICSAHDASLIAEAVRVVRLAGFRDVRYAQKPLRVEDLASWIHAAAGQAGPG